MNFVHLSNKRAGYFVVDALIHAPSHQRMTLFFSVSPDLETRQKDPLHLGVQVKGLSQDFPGAVQKGCIRSEKGKDSPRGTTGSRPPSGVPRATLCSHEGEQWLTGYI
ncbi:hypothetical protein NPIL_531601 [Nephila pilipes]|uniref:Uncharacterized protein n=1 Tax=Nephila pilipes TaxID=299642 RepID=A0A8X6U2C5_NEPPI|nr:hypothetical protein NPIL_531601 [Nephila pilipes]